MENYTEIELSFYSISFLLLTFIVVLYASFPAKFLKHPSQLYFYSLIFQVIYTVLFIALDILILRYFLFRNSLELMQAVYMLYLASFVFIMFYHYLLALNIEIILKILRTSSQGYKKRVFFYHFASIAMTIIIFTLALSATNFKFVVDDGNFKHGFVYNFIVWYIATISLTTWVCTAIYFKYMIKSRSTGLLNLVLLTIGINITVALGFLLPQTLYYFKVSDSLNMTGISWFITVINASAGIFEFVILVLNKKCIRFIVGIFRQQKNRFLSKERRSQSFIPVELRSDSQLLVEINSSQQNLDDGLLSDFFNNVTKQVFFI